MDKNGTPDVVGLERGVRPRAWAWKDEPSGQEVYSGWEMPRPTDGSEPLYDQAAIDAAVAAERERLQSMLEMAYCQKTGADSPHGLASCDNFKDWLTTLGA